MSGLSHGSSSSGPLHSSGNGGSNGSTQSFVQPQRTSEGASNEADELFPPKDKRARKLWHDLQAFRKKIVNGKKDTTLTLPPDSSYMRACAHSYATRLGMKTETLSLGQNRYVRVFAQDLMPGKQTTDSEQLQAESIEPPAGIDGLGTLAGSKRKEPPGGSAHGSADGSAAAASSSSSSNASAQPQAKEKQTIPKARSGNRRP